MGKCRIRVMLYVVEAAGCSCWPVVVGPPTAMYFGLGGHNMYIVFWRRGKTHKTTSETYDVARERETWLHSTTPRRCCSSYWWKYDMIYTNIGSEIVRCGKVSKSPDNGSRGLRDQACNTGDVVACVETAHRVTVDFKF